MCKNSFYFLFAIFFVCVPCGAQAATKPVAVKPAPMEIGGWIPYWRTATGTLDVLPHLSQLTEVSPFVFTLKKDGSLYDNGSLSQEPWVSFIAAAKKQKVRIVPTVMNGDGDMMQALLSNQKSRIALEVAIANMVHKNGFSGVDIDFEGKKAETRPYFSLFLKGLYERIGNQLVYCSIEPRTPVDARYGYGVTPPADATDYANDYVAINKYCDRVEIMAYDQGAIDVTLNKARAAPYVPVADPAWVEKVITLAEKSISKKKILIGIPTYGYEYSVKPLSEYGYRYSRLWAFNPTYALDIAKQLNTSPVRNSAGELSFIYKSSPGTVAGTASMQSIQPDPTIASNMMAGPAAIYSQAAIAQNVQPPFNIMWWSDAQSIKDKIALAQKLGVRGVSLFKLDGGEDQGIWNVLPTAAY